MVVKNTKSSGTTAAPLHIFILSLWDKKMLFLQILWTAVFFSDLIDLTCRKALHSKQDGSFEPTITPFCSQSATNYKQLLRAVHQ